jgi:hypothetical protein
MKNIKYKIGVDAAWIVDGAKQSAARNSDHGASWEQRLKPVAGKF